MSMKAYPNRIPPKATNNPITMAGSAEPGTSAGFLMPIRWRSKPLISSDNIEIVLTFKCDCELSGRPGNKHPGQSYPLGPL